AGGRSCWSSSAAPKARQSFARSRAASSRSSAPKGSALADEVARARVLVRGLVQGVFFRAELRDRARSLGLAGWVRNNADGTVEAVLEGPRDRVESVVSWCERGPRGAVVEGVDVSWEAPEGLRGFDIY